MKHHFSANARAVAGARTVTDMRAPAAADAGGANLHVYYVSMRQMARGIADSGTVRFILVDGGRLLFTQRGGRKPRDGYLVYSCFGRAPRERMACVDADAHKAWRRRNGMKPGSVLLDGAEKIAPPALTPVRTKRPLKDSRYRPRPSC